MNIFTLLKDCIHIFVTCLKSGFHGMYVWYRVSRLSGPIITILGGHLAPKDSEYSRLAYDIAYACVAHGKAVLTGGGPGIMEMANCGAYARAEQKKTPDIHTFGIGIYGIDLGYHNPCSPTVYVNTFFIRKWLFVNYSSAFIFLPGGIGTVDELFETLNMISMKQVKPMPIILVGSHYWQFLTDWITQAAHTHHLIDPQWLKLFTIVDSVEDTMAIIDTITVVKR